jgi:hypothetical protein
VQVVSLVGQQREADGFRGALAGDFEGRDRSPNHDASGKDDLIFLHDPVLVSSVFAWVFIAAVIGYRTYALVGPVRLVHRKVISA